MMGEPRTISTGELFRLLADDDRRRVVGHLVEADDGWATLDELAAALETSATSPEPGARRAELVLHHRHLPKLESCGVVDYDRQSRTVRYHSCERLERLLQFADAELE